METITHSIKYRKLEKHEKIQRGDKHSLNDGVDLNPIASIESEGQTPEQFSKNRTWWRAISIRVSK